MGGNQVGFATYSRSSFGVDYALNRWYGSGVGRFTAPDPYMATATGAGDPGNPQSWNRYAYVLNDPAGLFDPTGLAACPPGSSNSCVEVVDNIDQVPYIQAPIRRRVPTYTVTEWDDIHGKVRCPPVPMSKDGLAQIKKDIYTAINKSNEFWHIALQSSNPDADPTAAWAGMMAGWLTDQFQPGHAWDFKSNAQLLQTHGSLETRNLGNFNFGAVLGALGASYYFTQNAAGIAQIAIDVRYSQGLPFLAYPYGDSTVDAVQIRKGYDFVTTRPECLK